jgi:hypothetical protein
MGDQASRMLDTHTAKHHMVAIAKAMGIKSVPNPH